MVLSVSVLGCGGAKGIAQASPPAPAISRTLLEHHDLQDMPGWESRLYLIEYGPGVAAPVHHHPVVGMGYVVSGRFESAFEGEQPVTFGEGQSFTDRALVTHTLFRNPDPSKSLKFVLAYVVRKGEPVVETP
jgi:quercetin dioxygenase-like cupin family protein